MLSAIVQDGNDDEAYTQTHTQALTQDYTHQPQPDILPGHFNPILRMQKRKDKLCCLPKKGKTQISATILWLGAMFRKLILRSG